MIQILEIQNKIKRNIIDNSSYSKNNIHISFSIVEPDNLLMIHIYNPNSEKLIVNKNNKNFFTKVSNMLFSKNNKKKGCFNHQKDDNSYLYNKETTLSEVLNSFLQLEYTFILVNLNGFIPVSIFCLVKNYMYDVCTDYDQRNKGYMTKMLNHFFKLVENNKLKNGSHDKIVLDVVKINPDFKKVCDYYKDLFNFEDMQDLPNKLVMSKKI